jgi:hypothetical protein
METWRHGHGDIKRKTEAKAISLICLPFVTKRNLLFLVVCPFVDEETNGNYPFAKGLNALNGLNGLNGHAHLRICFLRRGRQHAAFDFS